MVLRWQSRDIIITPPFWNTQQDPVHNGFNMMRIDVRRTENEVVGDGEMDKKHTVNTVLFK